MDELLSRGLLPDSDHATPEQVLGFLNASRSGLGAGKGAESYEPPPAPTNLKESGLRSKTLLTLLAKTIYLMGLETSTEIAAHLKLSRVLVEQLMTGLRQQSLAEVRGTAPASVSELRYALTEAGKQFAAGAMEQCAYVGPAPVSFYQFRAQIYKQSTRKERITLKDLSSVLSHLVLPEHLIRRLGPAVNSAGVMLLYGPPGNGKSLISEAIGKVFKQAIYVPHCIEVEGQVIRLFDPTIHSEIASAESEGAHDRDYPVLLRKAHDPRWVKCRRPVVMMGGELTLDMLDLHFDETSKSYEAPPQMKALGGVCIIDDFGRQRASIRELLNRWIVPMEKNVDWLTLHTGQKLEVPFDEFVIFSTNIAPTEMMDAAHLRRIDYKLLVPPPSRDDYVVIFKRACQEHGLELPESIVQFLLEDFYPKHGVERAGFHPRFLVEHAIAACRYEGIAHQLTIDLVKDALQDLYVTTSPDKGLPIPAPATVQHK